MTTISKTTKKLSWGMAPLLLCTSLSFACSDGGEGGPANPRIAEIETTIDRGGDITIRRSEFVYVADRVKEIRFIENGTDDGRMEFAWANGQISDIVAVDAEGDRAEITWAYEKKRPTSLIFSVPSVSTVENKIEYDDAEGGREKQVTTTYSRVGESTNNTTYEYFRYNEDGLLEEIDNIDSDDSVVEEFRYDQDKRLERATRYRNNSHLNTINFYYDADGRLDEITSSDNDRYGLEYDNAGRLIETLHTGSASGETTTTRYTYESGTMAGYSQAPNLPYGRLIDLQGQTFGGIEFLHFAMTAPGDIERAPSGGGGSGGGSGGGGSGGGGGGGGATCNYTAETACDVCLFDKCCEPLEQCVGSLACNNYLECEEACTDSYCVDECRYAHPTGANEIDSYRYCAADFCGSDCDL